MKKLKVFSPYNNKLIKEIPMVGTEEVEKALTIAYGLFKDRSKWLPAYQRVEILERVAQIMSTRVEALINIAAEEGGKPYMDSKVEVLRAINGVKLAIEYTGQMKGGQIPITCIGNVMCNVFYRSSNIANNIKLWKINIIDLCREEINMYNCSTTLYHKKWRFLDYIMTNINN